MQLILKTNNSPKNMLYKNLTVIQTLTTVTYKDAQDIINPVYIVSGVSDADIKLCNYVENTSISRSYFVNNIEFIRNGVYALHCHIDVLSTYAADVALQSAIVSRQENDWNLYLNDGVFKVYQNPIVTTKAFTSGFSVLNFILAVAGN